jgi:hypothetical protein
LECDAHFPFSSFCGAHCMQNSEARHTADRRPQLSFPAQLRV